MAPRKVRRAGAALFVEVVVGSNMWAATCHRSSPEQRKRSGPGGSQRQDQEPGCEPGLEPMAGHSKWAKVKHFKGAIDAKRARIFAKLSREIAVAARIGGGEPDMNPRLRMALLKCRTANMPSDNIERAIRKGTGGGDTASFEDLTYEIYGPHGVA